MYKGDTMETIKYILTGFAIIAGLCCIVIYINDDNERSDYIVIAGIIIIVIFISYIIGYSVFNLQIPPN